MFLAALFVQENGVYYQPGIDPWPESRDARNYRGPMPVVAHPPCQLWGHFARLNYSRWGGEHNIPGNDGGCFAFAKWAVESFGGVLEHPANSYAFSAHGIPTPKGVGWFQVGPRHYTCEVWQSAYGHKAQKRTRLYYCGNAPHQLKWDRPAGIAQVGIGWNPRRPVLSKKEANATPILFAIELITLAVNSRP